jgi:SAM-dependent methyltransferases related to tRNA (uracil-5-)-methyltransferase
MTRRQILRYHSTHMADSKETRLHIEKLVAGGDGLGFLDGKAVFVPLALPGESVLVRPLPGKRDFLRAELVEVIEPSPNRIEPECPLYGECGGCNLQHLRYAEQLEAKSRIVAEAFSRIAHIELEPPPCAASEPFGYRNRMQFHFTPDRRLGLMRRASSEAVAVRSCPVAQAAIRGWIERCAGESSAYDELSPALGGSDRFLAFGNGGSLWLEGRDDIVAVQVSGRELRFSMKGFFQSNLGLLQSFVPEVVSGLEGGTAADLYCGVGLFGSFLVPFFEKIVCVEENRSALALAKSNLGAAAPGRGGRDEFYALSMEDWLRSGAAKRRFDLVLVDPPRSGLTPAVRSWLGRAKPPRFVYVSCDPVTLARDSAELLRSGYALCELKAFDFYPQTSHVECYARFSLR